MAPNRILVVANRTAAGPELLEELRRRAEEGPCSFVLLVPDMLDRDAAEWSLEEDLPTIEREVGQSVEALVGGPDPFVSVKSAVQQQHFDEIVISTLPERLSRWLKRQLPDRVEELGLPVTVVTAKELRGLPTPAMAAGGG
jgi:hypothetical protein